jgi:hypothetical protein
LRTRHLRADIILADGVPAGYQAARTADLLAAPGRPGEPGRADEPRWPPVVTLGAVTTGRAR